MVIRIPDLVRGKSSHSAPRSKAQPRPRRSRNPDPVALRVGAGFALAMVAGAALACGPRKSPSRCADEAAIATALQTLEAPELALPAEARARCEQARDFAECAQRQYPDQIREIMVDAAETHTRLERESGQRWLVEAGCDKKRTLATFKACAEPVLAGLSPGGILQATWPLQKPLMDRAAEADQQQRAANELAERRREEALASRMAVSCSKRGFRSGTVRIGMSRDEVMYCGWGKPLDVNRTTRASGVSEQWVYGGGNYLYFENGRLTTIQD